MSKDRGYAFSQINMEPVARSRGGRDVCIDASIFT